MTNETIIRKHQMQLIVAGIITTEEDIHTFEGWKQLGYSVKRGEKACARFSIWKMGKKKKTQTTDESEEKQTFDVGNFFLKESCFFSSRQVERRAPQAPTKHETSSWMIDAI